MGWVVGGARSPKPRALLRNPRATRARDCAAQRMHLRAPANHCRDSSVGRAQTEDPKVPDSIPGLGIGCFALPPARQWQIEAWQDSSLQSLAPKTNASSIRPRAFSHIPTHIHVREASGLAR